MSEATAPRAERMNDLLRLNALHAFATALVFRLHVDPEEIAGRIIVEPSNLHQIPLLVEIDGWWVIGVFDTKVFALQPGLVVTRDGEDGGMVLDAQEFAAMTEEPGGLPDPTLPAATIEQTRAWLEGAARVC